MTVRTYVTTIEKALIGQYGVFHVASLLCWMGYNAVPTSRNTKAVDLIVQNPRTDKAIGVQVKTMRQQHKKEPSKDFYAVVNTIPAEMDKTKDRFTNPFVFVYIPIGGKPVPQCFVVPKEDVFKLCKEQWAKYVSESRHRDSIDRIAKRLQPLSITIGQLEPNENKWDRLGLD